MIRFVDVEQLGLPEGGDAADWLDERDGKSPEELRRAIEQLPVEAPEDDGDEPVDPAHRWEPFPLDALPKVLRDFVAGVAQSMVCDPSYPALAVLVTLGAAIGNTRRLFINARWTAPAIIWGCIVGRSGTTKSAPMEAAVKPLRDRQVKELQSWQEAMKDHEVELQQYEKDLAAWRREKGESDPPEKPEAPKPRRYLTNDATIEALAAMLGISPRGVLAFCDELASWFGGFDKYSGGKGGADAGHWLALFHGRTMIVDRKTGDRRTIVVPNASAWVLGSIQPDTLRRILGRQHRESGLAARILFAYPPERKKRYSRAGIDPEVDGRYAGVVDRLLDLQSDCDDEGHEKPELVRLSPEADTIWERFYNDNAEAMANESSDDLTASLAKLEEYAPRLALVIHLARVAECDRSVANEGVVDALSMAAGVELTRWFVLQARRVFGTLDESPGERDRRELVGWIERRGGTVTPRELRQYNRRYREPGAADAALDDLAKHGLGCWEPAPLGTRGRPPRRFTVSTLSTSTK